MSEELSSPVPTADAMGVSIATLQIGSTCVTLPPSGVTAVVGGNNVGKSTLLRQIQQAIQGSPPEGGFTPNLLGDVTVEQRGTADDLMAWLRQHAHLIPRSTPPTFSRPGASAVQESEARTFWRGHFYAVGGLMGRGRLGGLTPYLVHLADALDRFSSVLPTARRDDIADPAQHPFHVLETRQEALEEVRQLAQDIFDTDLTFDRLSGKISFKVGSINVPEPLISLISTEYSEALTSLSPLHEQGHGIRSAMALLLPIVASTYPVILIDEPEAFLHPPQARALGATIARIATQRRIQVIVATHDRNFLAGLLEDTASAVSVVRLTRSGTTTTAHHLADRDLRAIWDEPSLRYTNVLDALFHRVAVLAENQRDCQFYAASADAAYEQGKTTVRPHDILFVPTNGKDGMAKLVSLLRAVAVPVIATPDLDVINAEHVVKKLVEALRPGEWETIAPFWRAATAEFREIRVPRLNRDVLSSIRAILEDNPDGVYTGETKQRVAGALLVESRWQALKDFGAIAMKADRGAAEKLLQALAATGLVPIHVGELEGFWREGRKGPMWLPGALGAGAHKSGEAVDHVARVLNALALVEDRA